MRVYQFAMSQILFLTENLILLFRVNLLVLRYFVTTCKKKKKKNTKKKNPTPHHPPNMGEHECYFPVFLKTFWHMIMLMKLLMTAPDVWGLWVVHLLATIVRG